jgi:hypothetical protein
MFSAFERMVAMRYLRARRQEGFISVIAGFSLLGIGLGVATLIIVMSVMNGFRHEILSNILGMNGHLAVYAGEGPLVDVDRAVRAVAGLAEVRSVMPTVEGQVMVTAAAQAAGALVRGVRPEDLRARPIIADNIVAGSLDGFAGEDVVAIGSRLARRLGLAAGDPITAISPQVTTTMVGAVPRMKAYRVGDLPDRWHALTTAFVHAARCGAIVSRPARWQPRGHGRRSDWWRGARRYPGGALGYRWSTAAGHAASLFKVDCNVVALILTLSSSPPSTSFPA